MKSTHFRIFYLSIINSVGEDRKSKYFRIIHNLHSIREKRNGSRRIKALTRVSLTLYRNTCECLLQIKIMRERQEKLESSPTRKYDLGISPFWFRHSWHTIDRCAITYFVFKQMITYTLNCNFECNTISLLHYHIQS